MRWAGVLDMWSKVVVMQNRRFVALLIANRRLVVLLIANGRLVASMRICASGRTRGGQ